MKQTLSGAIALLFTGCSEPELLAKHFSQVEENAVQFEARAQQIEQQQQKNIVDLIQKLKQEGEYRESYACLLQKEASPLTSDIKDNLCLLENDPSNHYYAKFEDKLYYQWEVFLHDFGEGKGEILVIGFNHRLEYDLFSKRKRYGKEQGYSIIDYISDFQIDKAKRWEFQADVSLIHDDDDPDNPEDIICKNASEIEKFGLPDNYRLFEHGGCLESKSYGLPFDSSIRTIYSTLVSETLRAMGGSKPELPLQFIDAWEQLKINEQKLKD